MHAVGGKQVFLACLIPDYILFRVFGAKYALRDFFEIKKIIDNVSIPMIAPHKIKHVFPRKKISVVFNKYNNFNDNDVFALYNQQMKYYFSDTKTEKTEF